MLPLIDTRQSDLYKYVIAVKLVIHDLKFLFSHKTSPMSTYIGIARAFDFRASFRVLFFLH